MIRRAQDIHDLLEAKRRRPFRLELPDLSPDENLRLERRVRASLHACGCPEGTVGLMLGLALVILAWALLPQVSWLVLIGLPLALTVAGKLFGLWRARRQIRRALATAGVG